MAYPDRTPTTRFFARNIAARLQALISQVGTLNTDVATMAGKVRDVAQVTVSSGGADVPAMALPGTTRDIVVELLKPFPDANYSAGPSLTGGAGLLGNLKLVGVTAQTATTVTVTVTTTGVVTTGARVTVLAVRHS